MVNTGPGHLWFVARPFALAGRPPGIALAVSCLLLLLVIFVAEVLTPGAVVAAFAIFPVAAASWMLSGRLAALVMGMVVLLLGIAALIETPNRITLLLVAIPVVALGGIARLYAANLRASHDDLAPLDADMHPVPPLTRRELEVARLAANAYTAAEIGHRLHIGERTVESHIASTYLKLRISSRSELIRMARRLG
jgi:DNA-binding CsgD family transcriptional regulator